MSLSPKYLEKLPEEMVELIAKLESQMISDLVSHIVKSDYTTYSKEWLIYKANELTLSQKEISKLISKQANIRESKLEELYTDAVKEALSEDSRIYREAVKIGSLSKESGEKLKPYFRSISFNNFFKRGLKSTGKLMRNLTKSMAANANKELSDALDYAYLLVGSGAYTPDNAVYMAVSELSKKGIGMISYPSGHTDHTDVAVRRAVRTGVNKTCLDMQMDLAQEMGSDLVEVSAHLGARPSHALWQGKIYSISGKSEKYKPFSVTGYGTGEGLGGWNCRHSFYPYFEGLSEPAQDNSFTDEENEEYYNLTQKQRSMERSIRKTKRELAAMDSGRKQAGSEELKQKFDKEFQRKSSVLKNQEKKLTEFCKENNLQKDNSRVRVYGFNKSVSGKAVQSAKKGLTSVGNGGIMYMVTPNVISSSLGANNTTTAKINNFKQEIANGNVNLSVDKANQEKHIYGKVWKNQVKQAIQSNGRLSPKSVLSNGIDPQKIIDKYAGKGDSYEYKGNNKYPDEYISFPFVIGKTYDKKAGKYVETHRAQIKYNGTNGVHIFPILEVKQID